MSDQTPNTTNADAFLAATPQIELVATCFERKDNMALAQALMLSGYGVRLNERAARIEVFHKDRPAWRQLDDHEESYMRDLISQVFSYATTRGPKPLAYGKDAWRDAISGMCHVRRIDPFLEWLYQLPDWDGEQRLPFMLTQLFDAPFDELSKWASISVLVGAVVRAQQPGAALDEMPVLLGPQGIGKSKIWPALLPPEHRADWFADKLDFATRSREQIEGTLGKVIVECSELAGLLGSDVERLKSYITRSNDGHTRLAYAHRPTPILRRFVIVGTTNRADCLPNDESGNRRFVVIRCPGNAIRGPVEAWADQRREQLWAEARYLVEEGADGRLPRDLINSQTNRNEAHRSANETVESAVAMLAAKADADGETLLALIDMLDAHSSARMVLEHSHQNEITRALNMQGWRRKRQRRGNKWLRLWVPPATETANVAT